MRQTAAFRDRNADIEKKGGQVVAISTDGVETLRRFREDRKASYPFLSDAGGKVAGQYSGTVPVLGLANRANYVVGQDRRIVSVVTGNAAVDPAASVDACPVRKG
jgi:peroxiredoxin Q/BCP